MKKIIAAFSIIAALIFAFTRAAQPTTQPANDFVRPYPIVGISGTATAAQKAAGKQIADAIGTPAFTEMDHNPTCCIWIEVTGWTPNPGEPGYFIINQGGGSIISASDEEQLKKAVEQFTKSIRKGPSGVEVPVGMMTSYRIVAAAAAGR